MNFATGAPKTFEYFNVSLNGHKIDTVTFHVTAKMTAADVKQSLVEHDGYDPNIVVRKER